MNADHALRRLAAAVAVSNDTEAKEALADIERELSIARGRGAAITEATHALLNSAAAYRLVFSHERDPLSLFEVETGRIVDVNDAWLALYGYTRAEALAMRVTDVSSEPAATHSAIARAKMGNGGRIDLRWHRKKDGTVFAVELTCGKLELDGRDVMYAAIRDISERIRAEEALARSEASFRALIESMQDFVVVQRHGKIVYMNPATSLALGYAPGEMLGRSILDLIHSDCHDIARQRIDTLLSQGKPAPLVEQRMLCKDGKVVVVEVSAMPTIFDGAPSIIALARDVSARRRMEAQLVMADRLASIGRLAASVGHEINNPLAYVLGTIALMQQDLGASTDLPAAYVARTAERLDVLKEGAERMRDIVRELKTFARPEDGVHGSVDLARVLDVCADMAFHDIRHRARLTKSYAPGLFAVGSEARLGQVFLNLLVNAGQAIPEGSPAAHEVRIIATRLDDARICVEVRDDGVGIRAQDLEYIFDPFFTTKAPGSSSGLGLSISHHIVTSLGGTIEARPNDPRGTSFIVVLPAAEAAAAASPPAGESTPPGRGHRVLIVDDEPALARVCAAELSNFDVVVAQSGREAIEMLSRRERFDVILCDLHMTNGSGIDVYEYCRQHQPGAERTIAFMTGGACTRAAQELLARIANPCLEKPFSASALRETVERLVTAAPRR